MPQETYFSDLQKPLIVQISVFLITIVYKYIHSSEMLSSKFRTRNTSLKNGGMTDTFPIVNWQLE